MSSNIWEQP